MARVILAGDELGRPMVAPPGVPADRVKILRDAYNKSLRDPDLVAEVNRSKLDMESSTGEEIQSLYKELMTQPREVIERVKKLEENSRQENLNYRLSKNWRKHPPRPHEPNIFNRQ